MKKNKVLRIAVAVLIVLTSTVVFPKEVRAATPQVQSVAPAKNAVISDYWDGVVTITYDRNIALGNDGYMKIYRRYYDNGWQDTLLDSLYVNSTRLSVSGDTLTIDFDCPVSASYYGTDFTGDVTNKYGNDYRYMYWVHIDGGAIESAGGDPASEFSRDDFQVYVQATPPEVVSLYPTTEDVNGDGLVLVMTFDEMPYLTYGTQWDSVIIYKYDENADSWETAPHITCTVSDENRAENQLLFTPDEALEPDTLYGVMVSGIANERGSTDKFIADYLLAVFPGIDYPYMYTDDFRFSDVWYFKTMDSFEPLTLDSTSPAAGDTEVPADGDLTMVFSDTVIANDDGGDYYVKIRDYDTDSLVSSIDVDDILPSGSGHQAVTISNSLFNLNKNKEYYVTIDQNAFRTTSLKYFSGIGDKSWYFSTTTTHRVRFYDYDNSLLKSQNVDHGSDAVPPDDPERDGYRFDGWDGDYTGVTEDRDLTAQYTKVYKLNYTAGDHGGIQGNASQTVEIFGDGTKVTAVPDAHYHFDEWSDGRTNASRTDKNIIHNVNVTAYFAIDRYTLTYTAGAHGSITGDTPQKVNYGEDGTLIIAEPDTGYHFLQWSDGITTKRRKDKDVSGDIDVTAQFEINQYTLAYTAGDHGSIQGVNPQTVDHGSDGTQVTAVADPHYHFVQWSDGVMTADRTDTGVTGNIDVTASFAIDRHTLTYVTDGHGTIQGDTPQTVDYGSDGTQVTAIPGTGYHFLQWSDGVTTASRTDTGVTGDIAVQAQFEINQYTLTYTAGSHGSIQGANPQTVDYGSDGSAVKAVPDTGYHFIRWSDGLTGATRTDTAVTADIDVTAQFEINIYTVVFADYDGTVLKRQRIKHGDDAAPPAEPSRTGYAFTGWDKGYKGITSDLKITAQYTAIPCTVTFKDYDGTVIATQYVPYGSAAAAPADPRRTGYVFTGWSDDLSNITGDLTVTAQYARRTNTVTFADHDGTVLKTESVPYGQGATAPDVGARDGYIFTGWDTAFDRVTADMTVTARYEPETSTEPTPAPQETPPVEISGTQREDDGTVVITVNAGERSIESASVPGGEVTVNADGSLSVLLDEGMDTGEVAITLTFSDGTTSTQTVSISDEPIPGSEASQTAQQDGNRFPWIWPIIIIILIAGGVVLVFYLRGKRK